MERRQANTVIIDTVKKTGIIYQYRDLPPKGDDGDIGQKMPEMQNPKPGLIHSIPPTHAKTVENKLQHHPVLLTPPLRLKLLTAGDKPVSVKPPVAKKQRTVTPGTITKPTPMLKIEKKKDRAGIKVRKSPEKIRINPDRNFFNMRKAAGRRMKTYQKIAAGLTVLGLLLLMLTYAPSAWYWAAGKVGINTNTKIIGSTFAEVDADAIQKKHSVYQPPLNNSLPLENRLIITAAKIDTAINEAPFDNFEDALKKGVWRESKFGTPMNREKPTILAAHRFGYLSWSVPYRLKNSFYNLPKVKIGDTIDIVWKQRLYHYAVYGEETGEVSNEMDADLILVTCQDLKSSVRVFKYAKLVQDN